MLKQVLIFALSFILIGCTSMQCEIPEDEQTPPTIKTATKWRKANSRTLIKGAPTDDYPQVVRINTEGAGCTASIVGPNTILTAAHCGNTGAVAKFKIGNVNHTAVLTRHPSYPQQDIDLAVGKINTEVKADFFSIAPLGSAKTNLEVRLLGYGCTEPGGKGGNDGVLRTALSSVIGFKNYDLVVKDKNGAALCFGDSGGPVMVSQAGLDKVQLAVNSKGNILDTSWVTRLDIKETRDFLAAQKDLKICGINMECLEPGEEPTPPAPECKPKKKEPTQFTFDNDYIQIQGLIK